MGGVKNAGFGTVNCSTITLKTSANPLCVCVCVRERVLLGGGGSWVVSFVSSRETWEYGWAYRLVGN